MINEFTNDGKTYPKGSKRNYYQNPQKVKPKRFRPEGQFEQEIGDLAGGIMLTTSEILDFSEGEDSY